MKDYSFKLTHLKNNLHFLKEFQNDIIDKWYNFLIEEDIIHSYEITKDILKKYYLSRILNSQIEYIKKQNFMLDIKNCRAIVELLVFLKEKNLESESLVILFYIFKDSLVEVLEEKGVLYKNLRKEIDIYFFILFEKMSKSYKEYFTIHEELIDLQSVKNLNLLNQYKKIVDESSIVSKTNKKGIITYVNDQFCKISGYSREELLGKPHNIIRHPHSPSEIFEDLWKTISKGKVWHGIIKNLKKDGSYFIVDATIVPIIGIDNEIIEFIAMRRDITESENQKEQLKMLNLAMNRNVKILYNSNYNLENKAFYDNLTGVYNRNKFIEIFLSEVKNATEFNIPLYLAILDIDHFKSINDNYGHNTGDIVLQSIAHLISHNIKPIDIFARWGGEEFVLLLKGISEEGCLKNILSRLKEKIEKKSISELKGKTVTASFGVVKLNLELDEIVEKNMNNADKALYKAKETGRNKICLFKSEDLIIDL